MQQIINFVIKNSQRLLFLLLFSISIGLTIQSHSYHKSKLITSANFLSGNVYEQINSINEYFNLKKQNQDLAIENARLKSLLFNKKDTTTIAAIDSVQGVKAVNVILSKVIRNSFNTPDNYLTINSGEQEGIKTDMGVVNDLGIVGIVEKTSTNFSTVLSILNTKSKINAKLKKSNHFGTLTWDAKSTGFVQLTDVPRLASVRKGDTIVTGGESDIFPGGINIGTIDRFYTDDETNYYTINVKLFNDMTNLGHVYIIKTKVREEILKLENETKKNE